MNGQRPKGWTVLGSGAMADSVRAELARDPDRYAPEQWRIDPDGQCPCCGELVYGCTTRHTGWRPGFATHSNVVHPSMDPETGRFADENTARAVSGCCCVAPNWGPKHSEDAEAKPPKKRRTKRRSR